MDQDDDVERLFSWIKTPDLHYREFAAERDVADAVAPWPTPRQAMPEPQREVEVHQHDAEIHQRDVESHHREAEIDPIEPRPSGRSPLGERLASIFGHREPAPQPPTFDPLPESPPREEPSGEVPWAPAEPSPVFAQLRKAPPPPEPRPAPVREPTVDATYRGFEQEDEAAPEPAPPPSDNGDGRSLDAIFSRVAHTPRAGRDERKRTSTGSGLGPVFRRLR